MAHRENGPAEKARTGKVQSFAALEMPFIKLSVAEPGLMRIGEQHSLARLGAAGTNGPGVGTRGCLDLLRRGRELAFGRVRLTEQELQQHMALVGQHVPGFEMRDDARL